MEIGDVHVLQRQENREYAKELIDKVASYVKPIMRRHGLKVGKLTEFFPKNPNLYGTNYGKGICISLRLRYSHDTTSFLDFESVLETMLHELAHNTVGPHNTRFFSVFESYKNEMFSMRAKGFKGDLFIGAGQRLGGSARPRPVLKASRPRGRKLGGRAKEGDVRSILADAAEKRRMADKMCAPVDFDDLGVEEITAEEFYKSARQWHSSESQIVDLTKKQCFVDLT
ncbi:DNA-dependent metalloprotease WSS1 [Wickerhamiella sorbophila]|uniref:DNA-dependent metalloprotease WSS1 n=1 Tax=Wickerhamiella sorbophila TaxID=45607 RepID=A0A2T0FCK9_9ASCO|nr:DNA-dependent metalloprotease WSS1 [Wickerhamiella sorbophila]PRT52700.1 DNA-dependent metalloprotease WSS1 [Wickerhamiella sorbophila]